MPARMTLAQELDIWQSHLALSTINIRRHHYDYIIIMILIIPVNNINIRRVSVINMELRRLQEFRDELKVQT